MRSYKALAIITVAVATLTLAACDNNKPNSPGNQFKRGAKEMAQGAKQMATQVKAAASDSAITAHVKARLAANQGLASFDIHVSTQGGIVTLTGEVDSKAAETLAAQVAGKTDGVRIVVDKLAVKGS
ncbi:MAG: BON domain-containing protein [Gammaproteobacteria bacterium]